LSLNAYKNARPAQRLVEGMTRDEACVRFHGKLLAVARKVYARVGDAGGVAMEDLVSHGVIGLLEAFDRFEQDKGIHFDAYAEYRIRGAMIDALRTMDTFTRRRRQASRRLADAARQARTALGREPSDGEIARTMGVEMDAYWEARDMAQPVTLTPIDGGEDEEIRDILAGGAADRRLAVTDARRALRDAIGGLPEREKQIVLLYYGREMSLAEIGEVFGVTPSRVCQVLSVARGKLRAALGQTIDLDAIGADEEAA
jgi:RNA polymerase sigma factor for flagellar operon FliA